MYKQTVAPRWRGFNLLGMFCSESSDFYAKKYTTFEDTKVRSPGFFEEDEFKIISDWGFDFARIPLSYRIFADLKNPYKIDEAKLAPLDDAVYWGQKHGLHISICMHRGYGYCVNADEPEAEQFELWKDKEAQEIFAYHWCEIAKRYADISSDKLTFDLINEPTGSVGGRNYSEVAHRTIDKVREISADRTFVLDGLSYGDIPPVDMVYTKLNNIMLSCRGYTPRGITHYKILSSYDSFTPMWPGAMECNSWPDKFCPIDRTSLEQHYDMWAAIGEIYKVGVHCGEFGCGNKTPHSVVLAWMEDLLSVLKERNIGWGMWNLSGVFGVMDSDRDDVEYENFLGHKLDRKMLNLLQKY